MRHPPRSGFRQVEHTADLALEMWAPSQEKLLTTGARALVDLITEGADLPFADSREIAVRAVDAPDRLVRWLNEILSLAQIDGFLFVAARLQLEGEGGLRAHVLGTENGKELLRSEVKSVTYHDVQLGRDATGHWSARIVIDV